MVASGMDARDVIVAPNLRASIGTQKYKAIWHGTKESGRSCTATDGQ
jgi:hypothetical protein